ncbi:hypothetical protein KA005_36705, partial [bacterium]|nr:hypothetical protein [bacterium]
EYQLTEIWEKVLGVKPIGVQDDFFELGGTSLLGMVLLTQIEKLTGKHFPLASFLYAPTIEQMVSILPKSQEKWSAPSSPLVAIQSGGSKPPLFLIHGADGNILIYRDLALHLGSDQPVYGLQSQGLNGKQPFVTRVEDMASHFIKEIKTVQPKGPYLLGGYCLGGSVAYEMAQQLHAQGQEADLLVLLETYNWSNIDVESLFYKIYFYIQKIEFHWRNFLLLKSKGKLTFLREKLSVAKNRRKVWYGMIMSIFGKHAHLVKGHDSYLSELWKINHQASDNYTPKPCPGRITQFLPIKHYARYSGPQLGWDKLAGGGLETYKLPVYPAGMLVEPFVRLLAEKLKVCIDEALKNRVKQIGMN